MRASSSIVCVLFIACETSGDARVDALEREADVAAPDVPAAVEVAACPRHVVVTPGLVVAPLTAVQVSVDGAPTSYAWSLAPPPNAAPLPEDQRALERVSYTPATPGAYLFRLATTTAEGPCPEVLAEVRVDAPAGLYVELTWDTPADADDPWDEGAVAGSDLDLHVLHALPDGPDGDGDGWLDGWFDPTWDCYWNDTDSEWGAVLLRDDTDSKGPEAVTLPVIADCVAVGVHYWEDNDFGPVTATLRILRDGLVIFSAREHLIENDLWRVAELCGGELQLRASFVVPIARTFGN